MKHVFSVDRFHRVPDGTLVSPFFNPRDNTSGLPEDLFADFSIAAGIIDPHSASKIHLMPLVSQVTYVLQGQVEIWMKDENTSRPYNLELVAEQAVLTRPKTFFQLVNKTDTPCHVLYIVSPAYVFLQNEQGSIIYDDSIVFDEDWKTLADMNWVLPNFAEDQHFMAMKNRRVEAQKFLWVLAF